MQRLTLGILLGAIAGFSLSYFNGVASDSLAENFNELNNKNIFLEKENDALQASIAKLRHQLATHTESASLDGAASLGESVAAPEPSIDVATELNTQDAISYGVDLAQQATAINKYLERLTQENSTVFVDMARSFSAETVDYDWALGYQDKLQTLLQTQRPFGDLTQTSVLCKASRCQIKVAVENQQQANQLAIRFSESLSQNTLTLNKVSVFPAVDLTQGVMDIYIAKSKNLAVFK
jgi:hypothetical protein